jgi:class 3 adenylate cyclase
MHAAAASARARVHLERGDVDAAVQSSRRGWQLWRQIDAPYEASLARVLLGLAYRAGGNDETAVLELRSARSALEKLGAIPDAMRVTGLLGEEVTALAGGRRVSRTFMFTDIVRSTNLVEAIGDEAWEDLVDWHDRTLRALFAEHEGSEVDHSGDGFFIAFDDPRSALASAVAIQRSLAEHRRTHGFAPPVRIGIHAAEATDRGGDYGGKGVHEAARIGALADGGEILASAETVETAEGDWQVSELREIQLKGISEPVRVVAVSWR